MTFLEKTSIFSLDQIDKKKTGEFMYKLAEIVSK